MFKNGKSKKFLPFFLFAVVVIVTFEIINLFPWSLDGIRTVFDVCAPIFAGFLIAFILYIPAQKLEDLFKKLKEKNFFNKHARGISVLITYIGFFIILGLLIYAILPVFASSVVEIAGNVPKYAQQIIDFIKRFANEDGKIIGIDITEVINSLPDAIRNFFSVEKILDILGGAYAVSTALVSAILSIILSVYMLLSRDALISTCGKIFGIVFVPTTVSKIRKYLRRISDIFYNYFYSQILDALVVSVVFSITFLIIGLPHSVFFGLFMGLCNLIPYFGAIIGGVAVSLVALITSGFTTALITAICIVVLMQLDANILQPRIVGDKVGIRPVYVLIAITLGGGFFGFIGVLLSVPFMATVRMITIDITRIVNKRRKERAAVPENGSDGDK